MAGNPYRTGISVGGTAAFVGRADVLRDVRRMLQRPGGSAIVLYGQRRIGKTSVLDHLTSSLAAEGTFSPVYFDLQDKAAWPLARVLQQLAAQIASTLGLPAPDLGDDPERRFQEQWLPSVLADQAAQRPLFLLFDEFDVLADPQGEQAAAALFPYLRDLLNLDPARLKFLFVIGRNIGDLATIALSLFKGTPSIHLSMLSRADTGELVRLSEANSSLRWQDEAVDRVWQLTSGHPLLTQQLCQLVWEQHHDRADEVAGPVTSAAVDEAVTEALDECRNAVEWLWNGLPPAARVVASALAEAGPAPLDRDGLDRVLQESGVRVVIRELRDAPRLLEQWDLLQPAETPAGSFRFRVEMLRRWVVEHKPLRRVQEELDHIEPVAESYYQAAVGQYQRRDLDEAADALQRAIKINPNHVKASQLLADIQIAQGQPAAAASVLRTLYEYQPAAARPRLVQALLAQADDQSDEDQRLALLEQVLKIDPQQATAQAGVRRIWRARAEAAAQRDDLAAARDAFERAGEQDRAAAISTELQRRQLEAVLLHLGSLIGQNDLGEAARLVQELTKTYPGLHDWDQEATRIEHLQGLADQYQQALGALQQGDRTRATQLLTEVVKIQPDYKEAARYLYLAITGSDPGPVDDAEVTGQAAAPSMPPPTAQAQPEHAPPRSQRRHLPSSLVITVLGIEVLVFTLLFLFGLGGPSPPATDLAPAPDPIETPTPSPIPQPTTVRLEITTGQPGAMISVDEKEVGLSPQEVALEPGRHQVKASKPGCDPAEQWLDLASSPPEPLSLTLRCPTATPTRTNTPRPTALPTRKPTATPAFENPPAGTAWTDPATGINLRFIPADSFVMGSPPDEPGRYDDEQQHEVVFTRGFWMGETEVTQGQWRALMGNQPSVFYKSGADYPVENVSWFDTIFFCNALSKKAGLSECYQLESCNNKQAGDGLHCDSVIFAGVACEGYRLPTEAEWEYAARAGTTTAFSTGENTSTNHANYNGNSPVSVGSLPANAWWLHEVHGNVWEWCWDRYGPYPALRHRDPVGPDAGATRILRGGSFANTARYLRSAVRVRYQPEYRGKAAGFRCARGARRKH